MSGMIMCLTREQRLLYILGEIFSIDHNLGAEIFDISPQNFRVKLHRTKKELYNYMNNKCGLVVKSSPCRCPKKAKALKGMGLLDEKNMIFNIKSKVKLANYVEKNYEKASDDLHENYGDLFRNHPARENFDKETLIKELVKNSGWWDYFNPDAL